MLALEFGSSMFGKLKPETKKRLKAVIENPCQETWEEAYTIILNQEGTMTTLWQAVIKVDWNMTTRKPLDAPWPYIPSSETIKEAINLAIFKGEKPKNWN